MEKKKNFIEWVKAHKKQLILAGISITVVIGFAIKIKNDEFLMEVWEKLKTQLKAHSSNEDSLVQIEFFQETFVEDVVTKSTYIMKEQTINVKQHIRNLAENCKPSAEKKLEAAKQGIELLDNQTIVNAHTRKIAA